MENAPEDLKELAQARGWTIGGHHLQDGVAEAIEALLSMQSGVTQTTHLEEPEEPLLSGSLKR